jgi:hypothetical protein
MIHQLCLPFDECLRQFAVDRGELISDYEVPVREGNHQRRLTVKMGKVVVGSIDVAVNEDYPVKGGVSAFVAYRERKRFEAIGNQIYARTFAMVSDKLSKKMRYVLDIDGIGFPLPLDHFKIALPFLYEVVQITGSVLADKDYMNAYGEFAAKQREVYRMADNLREQFLQDIKNNQA